MKKSCLPFLALPVLAALGLAVFLGQQLGETRAKPIAVRAAKPQPAAVLHRPTPTAVEPTISQPTELDLATAISQRRPLEELDHAAQTLAEANTPESVQALLDGIDRIKEWPVRAALAKNLRAISSPETLQALLPALLNNYGRGNTILNEISDAIARLAQPETVEALAALHWQASVQAGQGHKVLRTVASIRNPVAARGLMKIAHSTESPALAAAAAEALKEMGQN